MIIHHINKQQLTYLMEQFSKFTADGWLVPEWIILLKATMK